MAARLQTRYALYLSFFVALLIGAGFYHGLQRPQAGALGNASQSESRVQHTATDALRLSVESVDLSGLNSHVASPVQKELFQSALSESLSHYMSGSGFDVQMFVHQDVLQSSEPPDIRIFEGKAKFHEWFWSSVKLREGDFRVIPIMLAGKEQPSVEIEGENHMIGRRTSGLSCHNEPTSSQYCYEVQAPIEYKTPDGTIVGARLGFYFQWSEKAQRWVQSGTSLYGFPIGQPIFPLPG